MKFDPDYKPKRDKLSPTTAAMMDKVFYSRRSAGLNVQFINNGALDEWSYADIASRDKFIAALKRKNYEYAVSAVQS